MKKLILLIAILTCSIATGQQYIDAENTQVVGIQKKDTDSIAVFDGDGKFGYILKSNLNNYINEDKGTVENLQLIIDSLTTSATIVLQRGHVYVQKNSLVMKEGVILEGNGATLKRAAQEVTATTASVDQSDSVIPVDSIPSDWKVGDRIQLYEDNTIETSTFKDQVEISELSGNNITVVDSIGGSANSTTYTWGSGAKVRKVFPQIIDTDYNGVRLFGGDVKFTIKNLTLDGNKDENDGNYYWGVNPAIVNAGRSTIDNCVFKNMPNDCIYGIGYNVKNSEFKNLNASAYHQSGDWTKFPDGYYGYFTNNLVDNVSIIGDGINGHNEGAISFSFSSGRMIMSNNVFRNGNGQAILGTIAAAISNSDGSNQDFIFSNNFCENFPKIINGIGIADEPLRLPDNISIHDNTFSNCGENSYSSSGWLEAGTIKFYDNTLTNGTTVTNIPGKMKMSSLWEINGDDINYTTGNVSVNDGVTILPTGDSDFETFFSRDNWSIVNNKESGGWAKNFLEIRNTAGTVLTRIGVNGNGQSSVINFGYIGNSYNNNAIRWRQDKNVWIGAPNGISLPLHPLTVGDNYLVVTANGVGVGLNHTPASEKLEVDGNVLANGYIVDGATSNDFLLGDGTTTTLAAVATTGDYGDLSNTPTIPTVLNDLSDVDVDGGQANNDVLAWSSGDNYFKPIPHIGAGGSAHALATGSTAGFMSSELYDVVDGLKGFNPSSYAFVKFTQRNETCIVMNQDAISLFSGSKTFSTGEMNAMPYYEGELYFTLNDNNSPDISFTLQIGNTALGSGITHSLITKSEALIHVKFNLYFTDANTVYSKVEYRIINMDTGENLEYKVNLPTSIDITGQTKELRLMTTTDSGSGYTFCVAGGNLLKLK